MSFSEKGGFGSYTTHITNITEGKYKKKRKILWLKDLFMRQCCRVMTEEDVFLVNRFFLHQNCHVFDRVGQKHFYKDCFGQIKEFSNSVGIIGVCIAPAAKVIFDIYCSPLN